MADQLRIAKARMESAKLAAETANLAKSEFLASMSHELRTPLNAILGFAQLLGAGSPPPTSVQIARLDQINKAGWYLLDLINEILDLAVIESGKLSVLHEPVCLLDVMRECQAMIEPLAQQHDIKLSVFPFDNSWFAIADRTRIKQVLINLLSNAIKYNREHGTVEVKCTHTTPERLRISIKDSGMGLSPEKLTQLFQPFNRLGQETGIKEGTGIGLVVTKQLVELMGGTIGVDSTVGLGSEFWIELIRDVTT
jgi:signal transduction histidine kinase